MLSNWVEARTTAQTAVVSLTIGLAALAGLALWTSLSMQRAATHLHELNQISDRWGLVVQNVDVADHALVDYLRSGTSVMRQPVANSAGATVNGTCQAGDCVPTPGTEICNGLDDDCDGMVDVDAECPAASVCIEGACRRACDPEVEFPCPPDFVCEMPPDVTGSYCLPRNFLSEVLRALVVADHVRERRRRLLATRRAIGGYADRRDTARVNNTPHTRFASRGQDVTRPLDVGFVKLLRIERTQTVIRCYVKQRLAAGQGASQ